VIRQKAEGESSDSSGSEQDTETEMETDNDSDNKENQDERIAPGFDRWEKEPTQGERSDIARRGIVTDGWTAADTTVGELAFTTGGFVPTFWGAEQLGETSREARSGTDRETRGEASREPSREVSSGEALSARSRPAGLMPGFRERLEMPKTARAAPPSHSSKNMSDLPRRHSVSNNTSSNNIRSRSASSSSSTSSVRVGIRNSFDRVSSSSSPPIEAEPPSLHSTTQPRLRESVNLSPYKSSSQPPGNHSRPPCPSTRVLQERMQEGKQEGRQESRPESREERREEDRRDSKQESKKRAPSAARVRRPSSAVSRPSSVAGMPRVRAFPGVSPIDLRGISTRGHTIEDRVQPPQQEEFITSSHGHRDEFASSQAPQQGSRRLSAGSRAQTSQGQRPARKPSLASNMPASTTEYALPRSKERLDNMVETLTLTIPITLSLKLIATTSRRNSKAFWDQCIR
jgi:hypothetical protein